MGRVLGYECFVLDECFVLVEPDSGRPIPDLHMLLPAQLMTLTYVSVELDSFHIAEIHAHLIWLDPQRFGRRGFPRRWVLDV